MVHREFWHMLPPHFPLTHPSSRPRPPHYLTPYPHTLQAQPR